MDNIQAQFMPNFGDRIRKMNAMYRLAIHHTPTLPSNTPDRLEKFRKTLSKEVTELDDIIELSRDPSSEAGREHLAAAYGLDHKNPEHAEQIAGLCRSQEAVKLATMVAVADLLGDVMVYCRSEALKFGIPLESILDMIMDSNESKLGADGKPIYDENKKFQKGPNYWKPEPKMRELIEQIGVTQGDWE